MFAVGCELDLRLDDGVSANILDRKWLIVLTLLVRLLNIRSIVCLMLSRNTKEKNEKERQRWL